MLETDVEEILTFLGEPLRTFPDRSAKWLLANSNNLRELLQIIGSDIVNALDFSRARETTIENTVAILTTRFTDVDVNCLKSSLEMIADLDRLKQLNLNASLVSSFRDFQEALDRTSTQKQTNT